MALHGEWRERSAQCEDVERKDEWNTVRRDRINEHHCEHNEFFRKFMDYIHMNYRAKIYNGWHGREWVREMTWLSTDPLHPPPPPVQAWLNDPRGRWGIGCGREGDEDGDEDIKILMCVCCDCLRGRNHHVLYSGRHWGLPTVADGVRTHACTHTHAHTHTCVHTHARAHTHTHTQQ